MQFFDSVFRFTIFVIFISFLMISCDGFSNSNKEDLKSIENLPAEMPQNPFYDPSKNVQPTLEELLARRKDVLRKMAQTDYLVISEEYFLAQMLDIYLNFEVYQGKTIEVEGIFSFFFNENGVRNVPVVFRLGPGCCGNDDWAGFIIEYDGKFPKEDEWIKVVGTPKIIDDGDFRDLYLVASNIEVLNERGLEMVMH